MAIFGNPVGEALNGYAKPLSANSNGHSIPAPGESSPLTQTLAEEVQIGLTRLPKSLSSRFFYDDDRLLGDFVSPICTSSASVSVSLVGSPGAGIICPLPFTCRDTACPFTA